MTIFSLLVLLTPVFFSNMQRQMFVSSLFMVTRGEPQDMGFYSSLHVWYGEFIHLVKFLWLFSTKLSLLQWCTHNALFLLPSSLPLGVRPFGSKQHTPLIASSCLLYWVIGSIMHCGIYLWARMLCSARWGHSCQQECQQEFLKLGWTCENYIPR